MRCTIEATRSMSGWLCWEDGRCIWLLMRSMLLRLSVNMCIS